MFALLCSFVLICGVVTAKPQTTQTSTANTTIPTTTPTTTSIPRPTRCPTKDSLLADLVRLSKIHFALLQTDHQGYYKALKWNLDGAFTSLEAQFAKRITEVQQDMKEQLDKVQRENEALKSQHTSMTSQLTSVQQDLRMHISNGVTELKNLVKKTIHDACIRGKLLDNVCYQIITCKPKCYLPTAKLVCPNAGATLAPMRSEAIFNMMNAYRRELGVDWVLIDGTDEVKEGTWLYHDGSPMTYTKWESGHPKSNTGRNLLSIYNDKMQDTTPSYWYNGVACVWE